MFTIHANGRDYAVEGGFYKNGRSALILTNQAEDEVRIATFNAVEYRDHGLVAFAESHGQKGEDIIFVKTHAESAGIAEAMESAGLIVRSGTAVPMRSMTGIEICFITPKARKELPWETKTPPPK